MGVNPGFAGSQDAIRGIILNRYQWSGFKGVPRRWYLVRMHRYLYSAFCREWVSTSSTMNLGPEKQCLGKVSYAYKRPLKDRKFRNRNKPGSV